MLSCVNISIYDHDTKPVNQSDKALPGPVANLMDSIELKGSYTWSLKHKASLADVVSCRIAVVHVSGTDNELWQSVCVPHSDVAPGPTIRIRASTVGKQNVGNGSCEPYVTKDSVICLSLHQSFDSSENAPSVSDWQEILGLLCADNLLAIVSGDRARWPDALRKYFCCPPSTSLLVALAVLCQGYLAMHASSDGRPEGVKNGEYERVSEALESMGWVTLCRGGESRELLIEALMTDDIASKSARTELRREVTKGGGDSWKPLAEEKDLVIRFSNEWLLIESSELPENLKWLINRIADNKSIDDPGKVAQAYLDLVGALEAK